MVAFQCISFFLLVGLTAAAQNALCDKSLLFNSNPGKPIVILSYENGSIYTNLGASSVSYCLYAFLEERASQLEQTLFSYNSRETNVKDSIVLVARPKKNNTRVYFSGKEVIFSALPTIGQWTHACLTWSSATGVLRYYLDGQVVGKQEGIAKDGKIGGNGGLALGQWPQSFLSRYDAEDGFLGELTQVNAWNREITSLEVNRARAGKLFGNLISWRDSYWVLTNNPVVVTSTTPNTEIIRETCKRNIEDCKQRGSQNGNNVSTNLSICLLFKGGACGDQTFKLFSYENSCEDREISFILNDNNATSLVFGLESRKLTQVAMHPGWQHWCFVWSNGMMNVYADGKLGESLTGIGKGFTTSIDGDLYTHATNSRNRVTPKATSYTLWEKALTPEQVLEEYKNVMGNPKLMAVSDSSRI